MKSVIIAIHGLRNKPPKYTLTRWWKASIIEGFDVIHLPVPRFRLEMAYWSCYMHEKPLDINLPPSHPRYLSDPYVPGSSFGPREPRSLGEKIRSDLKTQLLKIFAGRSGFMNIDIIGNVILHRMFVEMDVYYHQELRDLQGRTAPAKQLIRGELADLIRKYRKKSICILAHSMGTIIAYDVLAHVVPDIPVHTLITLGSPLGFPIIKKHIREEWGLDPDGDAKLPTPESIRHRWVNFSDLDDVTCLDYNLRNDYVENSRGVRPFDEIVYNNYQCKGTWNPHKVYGYLRTAEVSQAIYHFLALENSSVWDRIRWIFTKPVF